MVTQVNLPFYSHRSHFTKLKVLKQFNPFLADRDRILKITKFEGPNLLRNTKLNNLKNRMKSKSCDLGAKMMVSM